jgi:thiol-disulfide isomerase/thioredoxin
MTRRLLALLVVLLTLVVSAGCAASAGSNGDRGYYQGDGTITELAVAKREKPGEVSGTTLEGKPVSLSDYAGKVVVINVWGSWCPPCRAEAADMAAAARQLMPQGVVFLGINTRDTSKDNALAFQRARDVPYPSIYDPGGRNLLAFDHTLSPNAIPSTLVIDPQGRVATIVLGAIPSTLTLVDLVKDVQK